MDKIELMENILSQYRNIQKVIKETEQDKKRGELLLNKEEERYDEAKAEFGEHLLDEYQTKVLEEYEKNVNDYKEKLGKIDETAKKLNEKKKLMYSDENIRNVTQGLMEIDKKIKQLQDYEQRLKKLMTEYNQEEKAKITSLAKLYTTMKPKDAARILNTLEMSILVPMLKEMKPSASSAILSQMNSEKAKAVTTELIGHNY